MVRKQESAEAIVAQRRGQCPGRHGEGLNIKERKGIHELCTYVESEWMSNRAGADRKNRLKFFITRLRPGDLDETPRADPHAGCCGGWGRKNPGYPIRGFMLHSMCPSRFYMGRLYNAEFCFSLFWRNHQLNIQKML